jgi:aromatic-L-amino-acid decarboxylase
LAARERTTEFQTNERGVDRPLTAYASTQTHSSVEKAVAIAGVGRNNLRLVDVDDTHAMRPDALGRAIEEDREAGRIPFVVFATTGTTSSTAMDPLREIGEVCRREKVWFHVDAAFAGTAALCPEHRWIHDGLELADSYCFNPHKWMLTNFDCDCFYVTDRAVLIRTLSVLPEYLKNKATETGAVFDYRDWHIPLGRRFRALKLWFVIRHYGIEGLRRHVREHVRLAQEFKTWVEADPDFEIAAPVPLNLVCFRHIGGDEANHRLMDRLNASGKIYLTHTKLKDKVTLRFAIGGVDTGAEHVRRAWDLIRQTSRDL